MKIPEGYILRPIQEQVLETLNKTRSDFSILNLPTGVGKSLIAETIALNNPTTVITKTKFLQDQYLDDFFFIDLKGKENYICKYGVTYSTEGCLKRMKRGNKECSF